MGENIPDWADRMRRDRRARGQSQRQAITELRSHASVALPEDASLLRSWRRWESGETLPTMVYQDAIAAMFGSVRTAFFAEPAADSMMMSNEETLELIQRLRSSSVDDVALDSLRVTVDRLCSQYAVQPAAEVRMEAEHWLAKLTDLQDRRITFRQHSEILTLAGWLTLLVSCLYYDEGNETAAEATRQGAVLLGREVGHSEIVGWGAEIKAWMALTRGDYPAVIAAAREGLAETTTHSVSVQLAAQEAKAWARFGNRTRTEVALDKGRDLLGRLPYPDNPRHHFQVDPAKWDFYAMDCYRGVHEDAMADSTAETVLRSSRTPTGIAVSPMRIAEAQLTQATVLARAGDLDGALMRASDAIQGSRRSLPSLLMVGGEFGAELANIHPNDPNVADFLGHLRDLSGSRRSGRALA